MTVTGQPDLDALKQWLGLDASDTQDDELLQMSLDAAIVAQCQVVCYPTDEFSDPVTTPDLVEALFLRAQRLAARRNSPEGIVGLSGTGGDFVSARVPTFDSDVTHLEGPYRKIAIS